MVIQALIFYLFATLLVVSGLMVITAKNQVYSVLYLILAFFNAAGLFVLLGAEFLAMILVVVYVGAVAVLFLFVVMMLDVDMGTVKRGVIRYLPFGLLVSGIILAEFFMVFSAWKIDPAMVKAQFQMPVLEQVTNTEALGMILYTDLIYLFWVSGLILLVAMIGAIVLTLRDKKQAKRQNISAQVNARAEDILSVKKVEIGAGITE
jgi:NADH-quinone oxidoreductase subunit J